MSSVGVLGIEESGRSVREIAFKHETVGLNNLINIRAMDPNGDSHDHVLWLFGDASIDAKEVGTFESLEPKTRRWLVT